MNQAVHDYLSALGSKGGKARIAQMTPEQRAELARKAGKASGVVRATKPGGTIVSQKVKAMLYEARRTGPQILFLIKDGRDAAYFLAGSPEAERAMSEHGPDSCVGTFDSDATMTGVYNEIMATL